jgi:hypothetical protein
VDAAVLIKAGDFKTGDVANFERVNERLEKIRKAVRRRASARGPSGFLQ